MIRTLTTFNKLTAARFPLLLPAVVGVIAGSSESRTFGVFALAVALLALAVEAGIRGAGRLNVS